MSWGLFAFSQEYWAAFLADAFEACFMQSFGFFRFFSDCDRKIVAGWLKELRPMFMEFSVLPALLSEGILGVEHVFGVRAHGETHEASVGSSEKREHALAICPRAFN
jgi:hypothetical protein